MLTDAWSLKPFLTQSSMIMSVTLGSSLIKNLTFQHTLINLPVVATINFASCVLFPVPYLMMQLLPSPCFVTSLFDYCCSVSVGLHVPLTLTARLDKSPSYCCPPNWGCPKICTNIAVYPSNNTL